MARRPMVCPHCGSPDLVEEAVGSRTFAVTYFSDGSSIERSGDEWDLVLRPGRLTCDGCSARLVYAELVEESASES